MSKFILTPLLAISGLEMDRVVVLPIKQIAPRSSIRGFKDDYHDVDADVVVIAGEVHATRKVVSKLFLSASLVSIELLHPEGDHALYE